MSTSAIVFLCLGVWANGWLLGYVLGRRSGHAQGWLDRWFQEQAERQPRNARGQFAERVSGGRN